jgi:hypothetical protein
VARPALVHHDLGTGEHPGEVTGAARVIQVDVGDHDRGQVGGTDAEPGQGIADQRRRRRGPGFHQARPLAADQVARGDLLVPGHERVDLVPVVTQVHHGFGAPGPDAAVLTRPILADRAGRIWWRSRRGTDASVRLPQAPAGPARPVAGFHPKPAGSS